MPNLPGRWVLAETGPLAGMWLRESATAHLDGFVERTGYSAGVQGAPAQRHSPRAAVHCRWRCGPRVPTVTATTSVMADAGPSSMAGRTGHVRGGRLDGYWLAESAVAFKPGSIERMGLPGAPSIDLSPGTHTGYRYSAQGGVTGSQTVHYGTARSVTVTAWKIVNGERTSWWQRRARRTWLPESSATRLHV